MTSWVPTTRAELIAALPWEAGYHFQDGDTAVIGLDRQGRPGICSPIITHKMSPEQTADAITSSEELLAQSGHTGMITVSYGGAAAEQTLIVHGSRPSEALSLSEAVRVEHGQVYSSPRPGQEPFTSRGALPDVSEQMRLRGFPDPHPSRDLMLDGLAPDPQQAVAPLNDQAAAALDEIMPGSQIQTAVTELQQLTHTTQPAEHRAANIAVLSHCVATGTIVRDAVALEAARAPETTTALIHAYKHAPAEHRAAMGVSAGMANFMRGGSSQATGQLVSEALNHLEQARGAQLTYNAASAGISGHQAMAVLDERMSTAVEAAELQWRTARGVQWMPTSRQRLMDEVQFTGPGW